MLDDFKVGPNVVRGFQPAGIGPRDITPGTSGDALGGTYYWGASLEVQYPFYFLPKDSGFRGAVFVDSGAEWGYKGETSWPSNGEVNGLITTNTGHPVFLRQLRHAIRRYRGATLVRRRQLDLGLAVRSAAFRFRLSDPETGVRPYPMVPVRRRYAVLTAPRDPGRGWTHAGFLPNQTRTDDRGDRHAHRRQAAASPLRLTDASATSRRLTGRGSPTLRFSTTRNISTRWRRRGPGRAYWRRALPRRRPLGLPFW